VKNCRFSDCPRNQREKLPILFDREKDSLTEIRFLVLSQEPGASLRKTYSNSIDIEKYLIRQCASTPNPWKVGLPAKIREIFNRKFDPRTGEIYWTHALKCVPRSDQDIKTEWEKCAHLCRCHLIDELGLIPSERLAIITLGNYALAMSRHLFEREPLSDTKGIMKCISTTDPEKEVGFRGKKISLFPFVHPARREAVLELYDKGRIVKNREKEFVERIRQMDRDCRIHSGIDPV